MGIFTTISTGEPDSFNSRRKQKGGVFLDFFGGGKGEVFGFWIGLKRS